MAKPKLTRDDCADLRRMYADKTRDVGVTNLAHLFKVTTGTVHRVLNNHYVPLEEYEQNLAERRKGRIKMSLDRNLENYREAYYQADESFRQVINEAFTAAHDVLKAHGWPVNNNDPAADLEAALVKYAVISLGADLNQQLKAPVVKS